MVIYKQERIYPLVQVVTEKPSRFCWLRSRLRLGLIEAVLTRRRGQLDWPVVMISEHKETLMMTNCEWFRLSSFLTLHIR